MSKALMWVVLGGAVLLGGAQLIRPAKTNPPAEPGRSIHATMAVPADVAATLERSCYDCHSNLTTWPSYSDIAPVSWLVVRDVNEGREHMNFSEWGSYSPEEQQDKLGDICEQVTAGEMPLWVYTLIHADARLTPAEREAICRWTESARRSQSTGARGAATPTP